MDTTNNKITTNKKDNSKKDSRLVFRRKSVYDQKESHINNSSKLNSPNNKESLVITNSKITNTKYHKGTKFYETAKAKMAEGSKIMMYGPYTKSTRKKRSSKEKIMTQS